MDADIPEKGVIFASRNTAWNTTTFKFPGGTAPTLISTAGVMNYLTLHTINQGTRINVFFAGAPI